MRHFNTWTGELRLVLEIAHDLVMQAVYALAGVYIRPIPVRVEE